MPRENRRLPEPNQGALQKMVREDAMEVGGKIVTPGDVIVVRQEGRRRDEEYWKMTVDSLRRDDENKVTWVVGEWFYTAADAAKEFPMSK
ncbi:hypothetical protein M413DRAFT_30979 [Hebeloma cylindrosporum]|uniref:BAH domain-containing protein n=1 Tax=Hebeloma cylindrosporum TaxID=76867 RepID=A0A0C3BYX7_HEBCY|nr:hypothetical protein M413DRAFT_30979 [Hebeloma cylindrosporum h7]